jgi:butyryl-CoA dehydrogenase
MDLDLSYEQLAVKQLVREFAEKEVAPVAQELDEREEFPYEIVHKMGDLGLLGLPFPEEYGGGGVDTVTYAVAVEEMARVDSSVAITMAANISLGGQPLNLFGTDEQKRRWLTPLAQGKFLGALGVTEPNGGSDTAGAKTTAVLDGDSWVINGSKAFITNAGTDVSGFVVITAVTARDDSNAEISQFIVPKETPGYTQGKPYKKIGWHASDTRELFFDNCRVPKDYLLGEKGKGLNQALAVLAGGRISIAAMGVGLAQGCLEMSLAYAKERQAFGRVIAEHQAVQFKLADMATEIELARLMTWKSAYLKDLGRPFAKEAAMAKLFASETAVRAAEQGVQIHGGYGYINEYPIARFYRDSKVLTIGEGTSEILRLLIARHLGCGERRSEQKLKERSTRS